jgi:hypothetical protein
VTKAREIRPLEDAIMPARDRKTLSPRNRKSHSLDTGLLALREEIITYRRELPRLLAEGHEARFVLIKGDKIISIWDTSQDAYQAGAARFGSEPYLAQRVDSRDLHRVFPKELDPPRAV